jgi:hypothetical protein
MSPTTRKKTRTLAAVGARAAHRIAVLLAINGNDFHI